MESKECELNVDKYREFIQTYIKLHMYNTAEYWADKVVALTNAKPKDVYWLAQCMYLQKQYHRAVHLLKSFNLHKTYILCNNLAVRCLLEANELTEALNIVNEVDIKQLLESTNDGFNLSLLDDTPKNVVQSSILFTKGKVLEAMDNRGLASDCFKQALQCDVHCVEAFDSLIQHHMLTATEEEDLLNSLPILQQCTSEQADVLTLLYKSKMKKYHGLSEMLVTPLDHIKSVQHSFNQNMPSSVLEVSSSAFISTPNDNNYKMPNIHLSAGSGKPENHLNLLLNSLDIIVAQAEKCFFDCDYQRCSELTEKVLKHDPYHMACLPIHISCQVQANKSNSLFQLSHKLVNLYPNLAVSWYSVGCYYYIIGKRDCARRYLAKATSLDRLFAPAWLAYGHSFAVENEHDQAMAAYFKASQLLKGCHLPLLYIGLECGLTNNLRLAEKFLQQANEIAPEDPFVIHEMGVVAFQNLDCRSAKKHYLKALELIKRDNRSVMPRVWSPLLNNLAHTCRKLKEYEEALKYHHEALFLNPLSPNIYSEIGFVHALMGDLQESIDWFHKALSLRRSDAFSSTMLNYVIEQHGEEDEPFPGAPGSIPDYELIKQSITTISEISETDNNEKDMSMEV